MKSAFSQGDIGEDTIYLTQPEGFNTKNPNKVLLLGKALYGLKQSANIWFNLLAKEIIAKLGERFIISDLGPIQSYFGIDITRSQDLKITTLLQKGYIEKVLKRFKMDQTNL